MDPADATWTPTLADRIRWAFQRLRLGSRWREFCERAKWLGYKPSGLVGYAERELRLAGAFDADSHYGGMLGPAVLRMVKAMDEEGHSGRSAGLALSLFQRVASYEPLCPLTGADDEWQEVQNGCWQNVRCSRVFKDADGRAYDIDGRIFRWPDGGCTTRRESKVYIEFPYTPKSEYVNVDAGGVPL